LVWSFGEREAKGDVPFSPRKVVGWSIGSRMKAQLVCDALMMAIWQRRPRKGLIVHTDRGSQYASKVTIGNCYFLMVLRAV